MTPYGQASSAAARAALIRQQRRVLRRANQILFELQSAVPPAVRRGAWARAVPRLYATLNQQLDEAVRLHRRLTIADVLDAWRPVFPDLEGVVTRVLRPAVYQQIRQHLPVPRLLSDMTLAAQEDVMALVARALAEGWSVTDTAKAVEAHLAGQRILRNRAGATIQHDTGVRDSRRAAAHLRHRALRLAVTEMNLARQETERVMMAASGEVTAVQWVRSANRGKTRIPDVCDLLATIDAFGLGRGVYPLARAPSTPHPFCRCRLLPVRPSRGPVPVPQSAPDTLLTASDNRQRRIAQDAMQAMGDGADFMNAVSAVLR